LTEAYNKIEIRAVDFGVGGSTVDGALIHPYAMGSSLKDFVNDFQGSYGDWTDAPGFDWKSEKSLFAFWFGVNDIAINHFKAEHGEEYVRAPLQEIFESYMMSLNTVRHSSRPLVIHQTHLTSFQLYDAGARNFLILTCPPFDRSIIDISDPWYAQRHLNTIADISAFNSRIYDMLYSFRANHTDAHASVFDAHRLFASVLDHPVDFPAMDGVHNTTGVCREADAEDQPGPLDVVYEQNICRNGELIRSYAWTGLHATYPVHNATAAQIVLDCFDGEGTGEFCT